MAVLPSAPPLGSDYWPFYWQDHGSWRTEAFRRPYHQPGDRLGAQRLLDEGNLRTVLQFRRDMHQVVNALPDGVRVPVAVTLKRPLDTQELTHLVRGSDIQLETCERSMRTSSGDRFLLSGVCGAPLTYRQEALLGLALAQTDEDATSVAQGFVGFGGVVSGKRAKELLSEDDVIAVDVSAYVIQ